MKALKKNPWLLPAVAAVLALVGFFMMFASQISYSVTTPSGTVIKEGVFGTEAIFGGSISVADLYFGNALKSNPTPLVGYILLAVAAVSYPVVMVFCKPLRKYFDFVAVVLFVVAAVLVLLSKSTFVTTNELSDIESSLGLANGVGVILAGVLAIVSAVVALVNGVIKFLK